MWRIKKILLNQFEEYKWVIIEDLKDLNFINKLTKKIILEIWCWNWVFFSNLVKNYFDDFCIWCDLRKDRLVKAIKKTEKLLFIDSNSLNEKICLFAGDWKELINILPNQSIKKLFLNFPDPRPRKREWKYRFFLPDILEILKKKIYKDWEIRIRTDDYDYFVFTRTIFFLYRKDFQETSYSLDVYWWDLLWDDELTPNVKTEFEQKWLESWKKIYQLIYKRK